MTQKLATPFICCWKLLSPGMWRRIFWQIYFHHQNHHLVALRYRYISGMTTQTKLAFTFTDVSVSNNTSLLAGFEGLIYLLFRCKLNARMSVLMTVLSKLASIFEIRKSCNDRSKFTHFCLTLVWNLQRDVTVHI